MKDDGVDLTHLIRSMQRAEGQSDCFGTAEGHCDRIDCAWRKYCLEKPKGDSPKEVSESEMEKGSD